MDDFSLITALAFAGHLVVILGVGSRVVMKRRPVGVSLAWLLVILTLPLLGAVAYWFFGERRLGEKRARAVDALLPGYRRWLAGLPRDAAVDWSGIGPEARPLHDLAVGTVGVPAMAGNRLSLYHHAEQSLRAILAAVESSVCAVHMEFYIWHEGGLVDEIAEALLRAAARGVVCRVLVDSVGSADFLDGPWPERLRGGGVRVRGALPVGPVRALFVRADHRLHRKVVVVDGNVAFTGSLNMVDPRFFKQEAGVGEWIDTLVRVEGPVVEALGVMFVADWELETGEGIEQVIETACLHPVPAVGDSAVQLVPSGPGFQPETIHQMLLTTLYAARRELVLTTPYFVPDDALIAAIKSAARRGVQVTVVVPAKVDSFLVRHASRAHFQELLEVGVRIACFRGGLLHTKSITVDGEIAVIGSVNLDMRSFWLNFEISLFVYDRRFAGELRAVQESYLVDADVLELESWRKRPFLRRFLENVALLAGPLL